MLRNWGGRRVAFGCGGLLVGLLLVMGGGLYLLQRAYDGEVDRVSGALPTGAGRPSSSGRGENWLLIGSDRRADMPSMGARADTIMLVHLSGRGDRVSVVAIPRDGWVPVPGHGRTKINAAFAYGGPALLVRSVEQLTRVRVDHFAALDFGGFVTMTDALGGVDVTITKKTFDPMHDRTWEAGRQHLNGVEALDFVRQRWNLPGGDLDRIKRQQAFLHALAAKALDTRNPIKIDRFIRAVTRSVTVDDSVTAGTLRGLAQRLLGTSLLEYVTAPVAGTAERDGQSVVLLDEDRSRELFTAVREDRVGDYVARNGAANSVDAVR
ncbi:LCP family protein [Actinomadura madurae]|uniref:LCP family protein n=2 Tax=Actinomadura madurae TaxID=1993 RepID=UPI0020D25CDF|nr:LCP family protein [Actinomadura madurae]MCP9950144.1 LCP family protein [Actinomadura madurae]MCP9979390.1 LCP family protein [Actinomadura madurae]MCQ0009091.1 LCP family protein [Actinomadura madurae]MCQ0015594.1 LCP family protein [Actinomadura madurae]